MSAERLSNIPGAAGQAVLRLGHSPDADDAFMFYALAEGRVDTGGVQYQHILKDIETLNAWALEGRLEITALSVHAYAYVSDKYTLTTCGASMGEGYGPMVVVREAVGQPSFDEARRLLKGRRIAIPGKLTSATLALQLFLPDFEQVIMPFDTIMEAVAAGQVEAGLLIHEGQLTHHEAGLHTVVDLGVWWQETFHLPLPLGVNGVRKDLGQPLLQQVARNLADSITFGLAHRQDALNHALSWARGLDPATADRFVGMYVNERTVDMGEEGREAIRLLLRLARERGLIPQAPEPEFIEA